MALSTINNSGLAAGTARANFGAGAVLQVLQTVKVDTYSSTATTWTDVTGVSLSITPASALNKVLISVNIAVGSSSASPDIMLRIVRDSTAIAIGNNGGTDQLTITPFSTAASSTTESYRSMANTVQYLDSPATTSAVTYKIQMRNWSNSDTYFVGRRGLNSSFIEPTFLTAMEIAG